MYITLLLSGLSLSLSVSLSLSLSLSLIISLYNHNKIVLISDWTIEGLEKEQIILIIIFIKLIKIYLNMHITHTCIIHILYIYTYISYIYYTLIDIFCDIQSLHIITIKRHFHIEQIEHRCKFWKNQNVFILKSIAEYRF